MNKKVVIAGSASLREKIEFWKNHWESRGFDVVNYPAPIPKETFLKDYPQVHKSFFEDIANSDILFVMNEDKGGIKGYLGAESFAEMCFGVAQNLIYNKNIQIIILQLPEKAVQSYDEITLWLKLGWVELYEKK